MSAANDARAEGHGRIYQSSGDQHIVEHHHQAPEWSGPDSVRRPAIGRAPVVLRDRTGELDRLRAAVEPGVGDRVYVLHGLGGCGKTAVAYTLFRHATEQVGRIGLWVNATDPASLRAGMLAIAADRGASDAELTGARSGLRPAADLVWHYLDRSDQPWLLVLDNADTPAVLRDGGWLRASPAGTVIVTTRQAAAHWWPGAELLQFGVLPREDAAAVLQDLAPHAGDLEDAAEVADRLGRLPLALTLAGGFLAHQVIDPWTLSEYRSRLDGSTGVLPIELLDQGAGTDSNSRQLLSRTWDLSLDALTAQGLPEATSLLRLLSCWAGDPLPLKVLTAAETAPGLHPSRIESALRGLLDHSLAELVPGQVRALRAHGILLDSVAQATPTSQREQLATTAARLLQVVLPEVPQRGEQDPVVAQLAPHVLAFLRRTAEWHLSLPSMESATECSVRLVIAIHRSGDYASALTLARDALETATPTLGTDSVFTLRLRQRVGRALFRLGRFEESEVVYRQVLEDCERKHGHDSPDTLESCLRLAHPVRNQDRPDEAISLTRRAVLGLEETFGNVHPLTLIARKCLLEMSRVASPPEQEKLLSSGAPLLQDCYSTVGKDHPVTRGVELSYASALTSAGNPREALPHIRKALAGFEEDHPPHSPALLNARRTFSATLGALGWHSEAIAQGKMVLDGRVQALGPMHPWTLEAKTLLEHHLNQCKAGTCDADHCDGPGAEG